MSSDHLLERLLRRMRERSQSSSRAKDRTKKLRHFEQLEARCLLTCASGDPGDDILTACDLAPNPGVVMELQEAIGDGSYFSGDVDLFRLSLNAGEQIDVDIDANATDDDGWISDLDSYIRVFDSQGIEIASNNDAQHPSDGYSSLGDAFLQFSVPTTGTYYVGVSEAANNSYDPNFAGSGFSYNTGDYLLQLLVIGSGGDTNQPPEAQDDNYSVDEDGTLTVPAPGLLANDSDPEGQSLSVSLELEPQRGSLTYLNADGSFEYTPNPGFKDSDSFTYKITDVGGKTDIGTAHITIVGGNNGGGGGVAVGDDVIVVNSAGDTLDFSDEWTTLREAVQTASSNGASRDTIRFDLPDGTNEILLSRPESILIDSDITIEGPVERDLTVKVPAFNLAGIRPFTIESGDVSFVGLGIHNETTIAEDGGAIWNDGTLTLVDVDVFGSSSNGNGGGIFNSGELNLVTSNIHDNSAGGNGGGIYSVGNVDISRSSIFRNEGILGGGLYIASGTDSDIHGSTISENTSTLTAAGIYVDGALQLSETTIADNASVWGTAGIEAAFNSSVTVSHSLIAQNSGDTDIAGNFLSSGHNLIGNLGFAIGFGTAGDQLGSQTAVIDPLIGVLQNNGGRTWTHQLLTGSPAIDAGSSTIGTATDQRGAPRVLDGLDPNAPLDETKTADIGAFEFGAFFVNTNVDETELTPLGDGRVAVAYGGDDSVSLRGAIQELNALSGFNNPNGGILDGVILFQPSYGGTLINSGSAEDDGLTGDLDIHGKLTVIGNGIEDTLIDGKHRSLYVEKMNSIEIGTNDMKYRFTIPWVDESPTLDDRIFHVHEGSELTLLDLTIAGGNALPDESESTGQGGAVLNDGGSLTLSQSLVGYNQGWQGGAITNRS
ncbi:MAG: choice-of-anchor Q domain-containing protein, partial [Planctomycetota bacterium]